MTSTQPTASQKPTVAIWRNRWLPRSETFVRDHVESLQRHQPFTLGLERLRDGMDFRPDCAPFPDSALGRRLERLSYRTGYRGVHDRAIARRRPVLLHAHFGVDAVTALPVVERHDLPLAVTFHGYDVMRAPQNLPGWVYRDHLAHLFERADVLLPVSEYLAGMLADLGAPREKMHVHYLGIPTDRYPYDDSASREGIVFVGRLVEQKGVVDLLDAVALLPEPLRSTPITFVGGGLMEQQLRDHAATLGLDARFVGWQTPAEVAGWFNRARVFVGPSRPAESGGAEGFGLVFLEAALAGTPTISTNLGGLPEAVEDGVTGILTPGRDIDALAAAIERVLGDDDLAHAMGQAGRQRVLERFDIKRRTPLLEDLYERIAR